jgi:AAA+ superfamily predicted ATPase
MNKKKIIPLLASLMIIGQQVQASQRYIGYYETPEGQRMKEYEKGRLREEMERYYRYQRRPGTLDIIGEAVAGGLQGIADSSAGSEIKDYFTRQITEFTREKSLWDMAYYGAYYAMIPMIAILMQKGTSAAIDIIKYKMTTPKLEIIDQSAHPKYGRMARLSRWWSGYKTPPTIFDQSVKDYLMEIQEKTKNIRNHILAGDKSATYANLLLYGPPGTGKTLFARVLADYTDMDFLPVTAAGLLQSTTAFNDLIEMANRSKYGTIIFIDEADALFIDRNKLLQSTATDALAQYKALNHILAKLGQRNNKFMIVAATNFAHVMDEAMERRFPEAVEMPLPDATTRLALLKLYVNNELFDEKSNSKEFITRARLLLTDVSISTLSDKLDGFSHAKIGDLVKAMKDATRATKDGMLTATIIKNTVDRAIQKHLVLEKNKKIREQFFADKSVAAQPS